MITWWRNEPCGACIRKFIKLVVVQYNPWLRERFRNYELRRKMRGKSQMEWNLDAAIRRSSCVNFLLWHRFRFLLFLIKKHCGKTCILYPLKWTLGLTLYLHNNKCTGVYDPQLLLNPGFSLVWLRDIVMSASEASVMEVTFNVCTHNVCLPVLSISLVIFIAFKILPV